MNRSTPEPQGRLTAPPLFPGKPSKHDHLPEPAYGLGLFVRCGLPMKRLTCDRKIWNRSHGLLRLEIQVNDGSEIPYGQDRALFVLLATMAWRQRSRTLELGSAYRLLHDLGQSATGTDYQRLSERFARLSACRVRTWSILNDGTIADERQYPLYEHAELWCQSKTTVAGTTRFRNVIVLSEDFCREIRRSPVQIPMPLLRSLVNAPGALDLSLFIAWRSHLVRPGRHVSIPVTGAGALAHQLSVEPYSQDRDFRRQVRTWLTRIKALWPGCPAVLTNDGKYLLICHGPLLVTEWEQ